MYGDGTTEGKTEAPVETKPEETPAPTEAKPEETPAPAVTETKEAPAAPVVPEPKTEEEKGVEKKAEEVAPAVAAEEKETEGK